MLGQTLVDLFGQITLAEQMAAGARMQQLGVAQHDVGAHVLGVREGHDVVIGPGHAQPAGQIPTDVGRPTHAEAAPDVFAAHVC